MAAFGALLPAGGAVGRGSADAFVTGFRHAVLAGSGVSLLGAVAAVILLGTRRARPDVIGVAVERAVKAAATDR